MGQYNATANKNERLFELGRSDGLGILVGNTRRLWPRFMQAFQADATLQADAHPLDTYVTGRLRALAARELGTGTQLVFAHATFPKAFPIQRLAEAVDYAALSPCHLSIHPAHGPWLALRAVVLVDVEGPAWQPARLASPCRGCSEPCMPALARAREASGTPLSAPSIAAHADAWIAIRDACPVGRGARYHEEQLAYHYRKAPLGRGPR